MQTHQNLDRKPIGAKHSRLGKTNTILLIFGPRKTRVYVESYSGMKLLHSERRSIRAHYFFPIISCLTDLNFFVSFQAGLLMAVHCVQPALSSITALSMVELFIPVVGIQ